MGLGGNFDGVNDTQILDNITAYGLSQLFNEGCEPIIPETPFVCENTSKW